MDVLVDYDNVLDELKHRGLPAISEAIVAAMGPEAFRSDPALRLRFYDGWYEQRTLSRRAQRLAGEFNGFPIQIKIRDGTNIIPVVTTAEPAYSVLADPTHHLLHTFRPKGVPVNLTCKNPLAIGCLETQCPMATVHSVFRQGWCTAPSCKHTKTSMIYQAQQKLVDSMLVADLLHLVHRGELRVGIVSSDDDFWPAIRAACAAGTEIVHINTRPRTPLINYSARLQTNYRSATI